MSTHSATTPQAREQRLRAKVAQLLDELAEARRWNESVAVCANHTTEITEARRLMREAAKWIATLPCKDDPSHLRCLTCEWQYRLRAFAGPAGEPTRTEEGKDD